MTAPFLKTKLYIPPARPNLVPRPRLSKRLNDALRSATKLILVSAPAGFGKTTLLIQWIHQGPIRSAWLSLDEGDNDPIRFWLYFIATLQTQQAELGKDALMLLQTPNQPPEVRLVLTSLINDIATLADDFVLVLNDYQNIDNPLIHQAVDFFIEHSPPQMHLAITTRADPLLEMSSWRANGQMIELRAADLRFTLDETLTFLNQKMNLSLTTYFPLPLIGGLI